MTPPYKSLFKENEVLLVYFNDKPAFFLRVENVKADQKKGWWQMEFLILTIPLNKTTWILDDEQMRGANFTMQGNPVRIERLKVPGETKPKPKPKPKHPPKTDKKAKIISLFGQEDQDSET